MHTVNPQLTLAEIVIQRPELASSLEWFDLDYCCGGSQRLVDAVHDRGLELGDVLAALDLVAPDPTRPDWQALDMADLVDHIETTHHRYLDEELPRLAALAAKVAGVHGDRHRELNQVSALVDALRSDFEPHLRKEEQVLFPMIRELTTAITMPSFHCGPLERPIAVMLEEHERTGALLVSLRTTTGGYELPDDACASYRGLYQGLADLESDTHLHVHKENNVLFPTVIEAERSLALFEGLRGDGPARPVA